MKKKDKYKETPFSYAIRSGNVEIVKLLLARDVSVNSKDEYGRTLFSYAIGNGNVKIVQLLLAREGVAVNLKDICGCRSSYAANVKIVKLLLMREDFDINSKDKNGQTPFSFAVQRGNVEIVKLLLA